RALVERGRVDVERDVDALEQGAWIRRGGGEQELRRGGAHQRHVLLKIAPNFLQSGLDFLLLLLDLERRAFGAGAAGGGSSAGGCSTSISPSSAPSSTVSGAVSGVGDRAPSTVRSSCRRSSSWAQASASSSSDPARPG